MAAVELDSMFVAGALVTIDPWSPNVLADDLRAASPVAYDMAVADGVAVPRMFGDGHDDLPPFCASGLDPQRLLSMPGRTRHYLAAATDLGDVYDRFSRDQYNPQAGYQCEAQAVAVRRLNDWVRGQGTDAIAQQQQRDALAAQRQQKLVQTLLVEGDRAYFALQDKFAAEDAAGFAALDAQMAAMGWNNGRFDATTVVREA